MLGIECDGSILPQRSFRSYSRRLRNNPQSTRVAHPSNLEYQVVEQSAKEIEKLDHILGEIIAQEVPTAKPLDPQTPCKANETANYDCGAKKADLPQMPLFNLDSNAINPQETDQRPLASNGRLSPGPEARNRMPDKESLLSEIDKAMFPAVQDKEPGGSRLTRRERWRTALGTCEGTPETMYAAITECDRAIAASRRDGPKVIAAIQAWFGVRKVHLLSEIYKAVFQGNTGDEPESSRLARLERWETALGNCEGTPESLYTAIAACDGAIANGRDGPKVLAAIRAWHASTKH